MCVLIIQSNLSQIFPSTLMCCKITPKYAERNDRPCQGEDMTPQHEEVTGMLNLRFV